MNNNYNKALEFFIENNISLNESILDNLKNKFENRNNIKEVYRVYYIPFNNTYIPDKFDLSMKSKLKDIIFYLDLRDLIIDLADIITDNIGKSRQDESPFIFSKNKAKELNKKYTLYTFSIYINSKEPIKQDTIDLYSSNIIDFNGKIIKKETKTLKTLLDRQHIKYEVDDIKEKFKDRIKLYNEIVSITNKILSNFKGNKDGFGIITKNNDYYKDDYTSFIRKQTDEINIISYNIYDYYNNDQNINYRDTNQTKNYYNDITKLTKLLQQGLKKYGSVDYDGDWDEGFIYIKIKSN